jgi:hypothetical protein
MNLALAGGPARQRGGCFQVSGSEEKATARANFRAIGLDLWFKVALVVMVPRINGPGRGYVATYPHSAISIMPAKLRNTSRHELTIGSIGPKLGYPTGPRSVRAHADC